MLRRVVLGLAVVGCALFQGCGATPSGGVTPPRGMLYNDQLAPLFPGKETGSKEGRASASSVLMLFGSGDCSLEAAAANGKIKQIKHVDYEYQNSFLVYQKFTTIVRGE
jgi:hypothetical protein